MRTSRFEDRNFKLDTATRMLDVLGLRGAKRTDFFVATEKESLDKLTRGNCVLGYHCYANYSLLFLVFRIPREQS